MSKHLFAKEVVGNEVHGRHVDQDASGYAVEGPFNGEGFMRVVVIRRSEKKRGKGSLRTALIKSAIDVDGFRPRVLV